MNRKNILIVESDDTWLQRYEKELSGFNLTAAGTLKEAWHYFSNEGPFDLIVVSGCLSQTEMCTSPFVTMVRGEGYQGPIVAASSTPTSRSKLFQAGCSHGVPNSKADTSSLVRQLLDD